MNMEYRLEELFDLQMGKTPARNNAEYWNSNDYKWISIGDLSKCGKYISKTKEYLSDKAVMESGISQIPANTVVMSFKLTIGKTAITAEPMYSNEAIMSFRDKHTVELIPDYIYYMFSGKDWDTGTNKAVMGKTLNKATLSKIKINVHSVEEQQLIIETLDKANAIIESRQQELQTLDDLVKARFVEMFGDVITNSNNWDEKLWNSVLVIKNGKNQKAVENKNGAYPICGSGGIMGYADDYISEENSVIIGRKGNINKPILMRQKYWNVDTAFGIEPNERVLTVDYLYWYCCFFDFEKLNKAVTIPSLTKADLLKIEMPLPPIELQNEFADFVKEVDKSKFVVQKALDEAQLLFDCLMQEYFG